MSQDPAALKRLREERALSQEALAARCGLSRKTVQRMERGDEVRPDTLSVVALALGVPVTDFATPSRDRRATADRQHVALRRVNSGKYVLQQLAETDIGRIECDVDASAQTLAPLTELVTTLQGLMRERWDVARPIRPALLDRLRIIAALNDNLAALEAHGVSLYMGHYYRFAALPGGQTAAPDLPRRAYVLSRAFITRRQRDRMQVRIDAEWVGAPEGFGDTGLAPAAAPAEATVFLYPTPPLRPADDTEDYLEGAFQVLRD